MRCLMAQVHSGCRCRSRSAAKCVESKDACVNSFHLVSVNLYNLGYIICSFINLGKSDIH